MNKRFIIKSKLVRDASIKHIQEFCKHDTVMEVIVRPYEEDRSTKQNALLWLWVSYIANYCGESQQQTKVDLCGKYLGYDEGISNGKKTFKEKGTSSLSMKKFTQFLNEVEMEAGEMGISLPHPEDMYYEAMGIKV